MITEVRLHAPVVEVFTPRQAPHLASIAREIEPAIAAELERALPDRAAIERLAAHIRLEAELQDAFRSFRRNLLRKIAIIPGD